jgi:peptidoglycan/LPS O-acetylase OafA/YrhL
MIMEINYDLKNYLGKNCSNQLKGIAILLVIINHFKINAHAGAWGVSIFLILSGFGLTRSYLKNEINNFVSKRISKVLLPYSIVALAWVIIDAFIGRKHSILSSILAICGMRFEATFDKSMWYITFLLIWYIIFYVVFRFISKNVIKIIVLFLFSILLYKFNFIFPQDTRSGLYVLEFPIGVLFGLFYDKIKEIKVRRIVIYHIVITFISALGFLILHKFSNSDKAFLVESLLFSISAISVFSLISIYSIKLKPLEYIGSISYEMYLFEYVFMYYYTFIFDLGINIWFERIIFLVFIICLSALYQKFIKVIDNKLIINKNQECVTQ